MQSFILSAFCSLFRMVYDTLKKSKTAKIFNKIYDGIASYFSKSFAVKLFTTPCEDLGKNSFIYKLCRFPFYILEFLSKLIYKPLSSFVEKSVISAFFKTFLNCFLALNTRFFASIIMGFGTFSFIASGFLIKYLVLTALGGFLLIKNINISDYLSSSTFVKLLQSLFDFKNISFDFYKKEYTKKPSCIISGLLTGFIMGIVFFKSSVLALAVPVGFLGLALVLTYPIVGIFAGVFLAPLIPTMLLAGICMFTLFALFLNKTLTPEYKWKTTGVGTALVILLVILLISSVLSFDPQKSLMVWAMYLVFFSFYFVIINTVETKKQLFSILKVFVISGAIVSVYGILQYIFGWNTQNAWIDEEMFEDATMRVYSTLENPNVLGEYLLLLLPVASVFMIKLEWKNLSKWTYGGIFALCALCLILTQSRGCWLGFLLACAVFVTFYKGKLWALVPFGILLLPFILPQTIIDRIMSIGDMGDSSTSYRVFIWYGTTEMLRKYFLGGIGMGEGAFRKIYPFYGYNTIVAPHSHNLFLQLTVEAGIGALILFLSAMVIFIKDSVKICVNNIKNSYEYLISLALASGILGFLLQSMFDYTFYNYRVMAIFIMYLAFGAVLKSFGKEDVYEENN